MSFTSRKYCTWGGSNIFDFFVEWIISTEIIGDRQVAVCIIFLIAFLTIQIQ